MKTNWKRIGLTIIIGLFFVVAIVVGNRFGHSSPERIITLPNGDQYRFAGTTYSKENVPPSFLAHLVRWLPPGLEASARTHFGSRISQYNLGEKSETAQLYIWFQYTGRKTPPTMSSSSFPSNARLADETGVQSGSTGFAGFSKSVAWSYLSFRIVPRRSRNLRCFFYSTTRTTEVVEPFSTLTFRNPLYGRFPQWAPEAVPSVKRVGDLEVRLDKLETGLPHGGPLMSKSNGSLGRNYVAIHGSESINDTEVELSLRSLSTPGEYWIPQSAELSDATGNILRGTLTGGLLVRSSPIATPTNWVGTSESISGALWPDEAAWKLRLELKRSSGFAPGELLTFKGVPIPPVGGSNAVSIIKLISGIEVALTKFVRQPNLTGGSKVPYEFITQIGIALPGRPKGVAIDFVDMTTDTRDSVETIGYGRSVFGYNLFVKSIPTNAHTIDLTFAVQKTRSVEFLVKPPGAK